jgi:hypothetical protein
MYIFIHICYIHIYIYVYLYIQVTLGSKADQLGLKLGDIIVATSATAGDQMWTHESDESVKSALNTRYVHTSMCMYNIICTVYINIYVCIFVYMLSNVDK